MRRPADAERGAVLIWVVLGLVAFGSLTALAINIGRMLSVRGGLQNGADGAALAAAAELDGEATGIANGADAAVALAARHGTDSGQVIALDRDADVIFGTWDRQARTFTRVDGRSGAELRNINAVRVLDGREAARGNAVPIVFGGAFLDRRTVDVASAAIAVGGGPCGSDCAFPAAFADCMLVNPDGSLNCDGRIFTLNNDWQDNLGLTSLEPGVSASVPNIKDALSQCVSSAADEEIPVTNGNPMQPISNDPFFGQLPRDVLAPVVHVERCEPQRYEQCQRANPGSPCLNAKFVGDMTVVGYVSITVCYATGANVKAWPPADWPGGSCGAPPTIADYPGLDPAHWPDFLAQTMFLRVRCDVELPGDSAGTAGCGFFGTTSPRSRLVQ